MCDDSECFVSPYPDMPLNIYVAFYRYGCGAAKATVPNLDMEQLPSVASKEISQMFKPPDIPTMNVTLDIDTQELAPKIVTPTEGRFVEPKEKTKFMEKLSLRPKVLTVKPPPLQEGLRKMTILIMCHLRLTQVRRRTPLLYLYRSRNQKVLKCGKLDL